MRNIVAAIDLDNEKQQHDILNIATEWAGAFEAKLWVLYTALDAPGPADYDAGPQTVRDRISCMVRERHRQLQDTAHKAARSKDIEVTALMVKGEPADEILEHARREDADLIVVGHPNRWGLVTAILGDTAHNVIGHAKRPVLVVP
jgi:nucleotide-binding universal stress UspA family protein